MTIGLDGWTERLIVAERIIADHQKRIATLPAGPAREAEKWALMQAFLTERRAKRKVDDLTAQRDRRLNTLTPAARARLFPKLP